MHETATYRSDDTRGCLMQFWPHDEHMCSKHVEAWNKLIVKQKFRASSWLITKINILRCTVSKTSKNKIPDTQFTYWFFFVLNNLSSSPPFSPSLILSCQCLAKICRTQTDILYHCMGSQNLLTYCQKLPASVTWKIPVNLTFPTAFCGAPKHIYLNPQNRDELCP